MPTKDTDDGPVVDQLPAGEEVVNKDISKQRRKIMKASAAIVPAIMTIRSGAAVAMSSIHQCVEANAALSPAEPVVSALDEWARVKGWQVTHGNETYYCVKSNGTWECYNKDGDPPTGGWADETYITAHGEEVYLLAYVDTDPVNGSDYTWYLRKGTFSGDSWVSQYGSQITGTCLASVDPKMAEIFSQDG